MRYRIFWAVVGLIFFVLLIPVSISFFFDCKVYSQGKIVDVVITTLPGNYSTKTEYMGFKIDEKIYKKRVGRAFRNTHHIGDTLKLRYLSGYETHFLLPNESPFVSGFLLILLFTFLGTTSFYYAFKKQSFTLPFKNQH